MTFIEAAMAVLEREGRNMSSREIADKAVSMGILSHVGKTPVQTMSARMSASVAKGDKKGPFVRVGRGVFGLVSWNGKPPGPKRVPSPPPKESGPAQAPAAEGAQGKITRDSATSKEEQRDGAAQKEARSDGTAQKETQFDGAAQKEAQPDGAAQKKAPSALLQSERLAERPSPEVSGPKHQKEPPEGEMSEVRSSKPPEQRDIPRDGADAPSKKRKRKRRKGAGNGEPQDAKAPPKVETESAPAQPPSAAPRHPVQPQPGPSPWKDEETNDLTDQVEALLRKTEKPLSTEDILKEMGLAGSATATLLAALLAADGFDRESQGQRARFVKHKSGYRLLEREISSEIIALERQANETRDRLVRFVEKQVLRKLRGLSMGAFARVMITYLHRSGFGAMVPVDLASPGEFHLSVQDRRHRGRFRTAVVLRRDPANHALSERAVMDLRGAIHHYDAMGGMILTTGQVLERATMEGRIANLPPIALIDGETLARELVRLGIGIKSRSISLPAYDDAFFSALE